MSTASMNATNALDAWNALKEKIRLIPISAIISKYIPVTKKGANFEGICPFHKDTHPSLKVNDPKNLFKCFACGMAGDSVKFVMEIKKITFKEALESIANDFNLSLPTKQVKKINPKIQSYLDCHAITLQFYLDLTQKEHQGELTHFAEDRKLSQETLQKFKICFAPEGKQLANYLFKLKTDYNATHYDAALELGLIKMGEHGHYDNFRRRIMFPIFNPTGQIVAFGSRSTYEGQIPKYLNSQESLIFNKRHILYGLPLARSKIREHSSVFIVEGYMDAIMMHQAGIENTVAAMGIAFTQDHLNELGPNIKHFYLLFDQDSAGEIAAKRTLPLFLKHKVQPLKLDLLSQKDPDDFIKKEGSIALQNQIKIATPWLDYFLDQLSQTNTGDNIDAKLNLLKEAFELLRPLHNELSATERVITFAKKIGLNSPESSLLDQFYQYLKDKIAPSWTPSKMENDTAAITLPEIPQTQTSELESISKNELYILKQILKNPELIKLESFTEVLEFVNNKQVKDLLLFLPKMTAEIEFADYEQTIISFIDERNYAPEIKQLACEVFFQWSPQMQMDETILKKQFLDLKKKLLIERLISEKNALKMNHKNLTTQDDLQDLLRKVHFIDKKIFELKSSENNSGIQKG
jgi:DNA primase